MDSSDQRPKRKRVSNHYYALRFLSLSTVFMCLSFLTFLYIVSHASSFASSPFKPVLVVSRKPLLASSSSVTATSFRGFRSFSPRLIKIESRVLFPDHVLLLVNNQKDGVNITKSDAVKLECVYYYGNQTLNGFKNGEHGRFLRSRVLSVDEYDGFRSIVRCPIPSVNYSLVYLKWRGKYNFLGTKNRFRVISSTTSITSWDNVVYDAVADDDNSVVVFVKGLNLRPDRESDPSQYSCHFDAEMQGRNSNFTIKTAALTAAQEIVRCPLPVSIKTNQEVRVTIGVLPHVRAARRGLEHIFLPSIAKISNMGPKMITDTGAKRYKLCACTMLWNQASAMREWITYHSWLGIERWFIYDNNSDDEISEVVQELVHENYKVSRHVWPWIKTQEAGFSHCALRAKNECEWVSFMDVDEYFYFPYNTHEHQSFRALGYAAKDSLHELVKNISSSSSSNNIAEIRTSCHSFGPSGLKSRPIRGVTVGYTCRLQSPERHKSIIKPDALDSTMLNVVHHFHLKKGYEYINLPQSAVVINHYKYQVWEVFKAKFHRRVATYVADWGENQNEGSRDRAPGLGTKAIEPLDWAQRFCEVWDTGLRDFALSNLADVSTGLLPWEKGSSLTN